MVDPKEYAPGSTSVACWLWEFVYGSLLNFVRPVTATLGVDVEVCAGEALDELPPQPLVSKASVTRAAPVKIGFRIARKEMIIY
jgi:hypothetical protein